jgi:hypothetical protein
MFLIHVFFAPCCSVSFPEKPGPFSMSEPTCFALPTLLFLPSPPASLLIPCFKFSSRGDYAVPSRSQPPVVLWLDHWTAKMRKFRAITLSISLVVSSWCVGSTFMLGNNKRKCYGRGGIKVRGEAILSFASAK